MPWGERVRGELLFARFLLGIVLRRWKGGKDCMVWWVGLGFGSGVIGWFPLGEWILRELNVLVPGRQGG